MDRQTDIQRDQDTGKQTDRKVETLQISVQTGRKLTDRQVHMQTDRQKNRQTDRKKTRQTDKRN